MVQTSSATVVWTIAVYSPSLDHVPSIFHPTYFNSTHSMQSFTFLILPAVLCVLVVSAGCEDRRYQPAEWNSTSMPAKVEQSDKAESTKPKKSPEKPTDWMTMAGKGGEKVKSRSSLPTATNRGGTMPVRSSGTSLPARGTSMPARQINSQNGTSLPARGGPLCLGDSF